MAILKTANPVKRGGLQQNQVQKLVGQLAVPAVIVGAVLYKLVWVPWKAKKSGKKPAGSEAAAPKAAAATAVARSKPRRDYKVKRQDDEELRAAAAQARLEAMAAAAGMVPEDFEQGDEEQEEGDAAGAAGGAQGAGGQGNFFSMLQKLGYKVVMPSDGSGQVYLVPPGGEGGEASGPGHQELDNDDAGGDELHSHEDQLDQEQPGQTQQGRQGQAQPVQQTAHHQSTSTSLQQQQQQQQARSARDDTASDASSTEHINLTQGYQTTDAAWRAAAQQAGQPLLPPGQYLDYDYDDDDYDLDLDLDYDLDDLLDGLPLEGMGGAAGGRGMPWPPGGGGAGRGRGRMSDVMLQGGYLPGAGPDGGEGQAAGDGTRVGPGMEELFMMGDDDDYDDDDDDGWADQLGRAGFDGDDGLFDDELGMDGFDEELAEMIMADMMREMSGGAGAYPGGRQQQAASGGYMMTGRGAAAGNRGGEDFIPEGDEEGYDEDEGAEEEEEEEA